MNETSAFLDAFHLIRPWWLLALLPVLVAWWRWRRNTDSQAMQPGSLAPHLEKALTIGASQKFRLRPIDVAAACLVLLVVAAAGPSWSRMPNPFVAQSAPLVIVLKVTPSMTSADVAPTRLERARQKIQDLLALRVGARTAVIAYAGSAHRVVPLTRDPNLVAPYLEGLSPEIMPVAGDDLDAALALAGEILAGQATAGSALLITDSIMPDMGGVLDGSLGYSPAVLAILPEGESDPGIDGLRRTPVVRVAVDDADVNELERIIRADYRRALSQDGKQPWQDRGWWLAWPAALLLLLAFRKGFTLERPPRSVTPLALLVLSMTLVAPNPARAEGVADWFFTPDQQGQRAMNDKDFETAAGRFVDPSWKNYALYRQGKYEDAAEGYSQMQSAAASFAQGMALIKSRKYRDAVRAFELTLERDPDYPGAAQNLETAREIVVYIEDTREQSDTGEEAGIGADDVVFDNESGRGADTQIEPGEDSSGLLSEDQWMNTVDTRTGDFLRQRFAIEASRPDAGEGR